MNVGEERERKRIGEKKKKKTDKKMVPRGKSFRVFQI